MAINTETQEIYPDGDGSHVLKQGLEHVNHLVRWVRVATIFEAISSPVVTQRNKDVSSEGDWGEWWNLIPWKYYLSWRTYKDQRKHISILPTVWPLKAIPIPVPRASTSSQLHKPWWTQLSKSQNLLVKSLDNKGHKTGEQSDTLWSPASRRATINSFLPRIYALFSTERWGLLLHSVENGLVCDFFDQVTRCLIPSL